MKCPICENYFNGNMKQFRKLYKENGMIKVCPTCYDKEMEHEL